MSTALIRSIVLYVSDPATSQRFYERALGITASGVTNGRVEFEAGGIRLLLHPTSVDEHDRAAARHGRTEVYFTVDDLEASLVRLREGGAEVIQEIIEQPWGERDAAVVDPDGFPLFLTQAA
ncbi:VOC family protein [Nesterenkonia ebinurensis]|uniref:VOC family protein n=1 Tax=Nesterenkonia ebinurensis TaxID=2608252 RepID=UPI00123D8C4E|nr:VOC family protein [Nesterenkonia ebinurensis]